MAEVTLTPAQKAVIEHRGGALLVSAAAGSGKTKVLVDRVLEQVCDRTQPVNIDEFLIITFSEAAAAEMRAKIMKELAKRQSADPENRHLQRQSARICAAQISTVHAFCSSILRKYCHLAGVNADFRVCDQLEGDRLLADSLEDVLTEQYESIREDGDFAAFVEQFGYGRDDWRLKDVVTNVYHSVRNRPEPLAWLTRCEQAVALAGVSDFSETPWGEYLLGSFAGTLTLACDMEQRAMTLARKDPVLKEKYLPVFENNLAIIKATAKITSWDALTQAGEVKFGRLPNAAKDAAEDLKEQAKALNDEAKKLYSKALKAFSASSAELIAQTRACAPAVRGLCQTVRKLHERFTAEKRRRKLLDFSDLEHETIALIRDQKTGLPTACAKEIAAGYREIMVDEYQDSNAVQETIFSMLSKDGRNRFMVGDVKQSIYRFRNADPTIFLEKYERFGTEENEQGRKILLSENFRSRPEILSCVNDVFSLVMSKQMGEIDYTEQEALKNGKPFPPSPQAKIELHCIEMEKTAEEDDAGPSPERAATEAEFVAARIARLLAERTLVTDGDTVRPCRAEDIVILLRSPKSTARYYKQALTRYDIPCVSDRAGDVLKTTEVETLFAILQIIDNPMQDIPLLCAMLSPVFAFSPEEAALCRTEKRKGSYYECLTAYEEKSEKLKSFLSWLTQMREQAGELSLRELIDLVLRTTNLIEIFAAAENGRARENNLHTFLSFAAEYEQRNGPSLGGFTRMVSRMIADEKALDPSGGGTTADAVQIVSIHHSKGLEYPIVILADLAGKFNRESLREPVLLDEKLFIGTNIVDPATKSYYSGVCKQAIVRKMMRQGDSEEMRNLYVAMTRAKDMLIMTYCKGNLTKRLKNLSGLLSVPLNPEVAASADCLGDWVLLAALCRTESGELFAACGENPCSSVTDMPWVVRMHYTSGAVGTAQLHAGVEQKTAAAQNGSPAVWEETSYPYEKAAVIPSKLTATQLKGRTLDMETAEQTEQPLAHSTWRKPSFLPKTTLSGTEKGNATHLFMQFVRYECCQTAEGIAEEKQRLVAMRFLSPQQAEAVDDGAILRLFGSAFGKEILQAQNAKREFKFSLLVDAGEFFDGGSGEKVMLQGVVDCFWEDAEGLVILDYKTDRITGNLAEKAGYYTPQVQTYCKALSRIYKKPVKAAYLYFFDADRAEKIPL